MAEDQQFYLFRGVYVDICNNVMSIRMIMRTDNFDKNKREYINIDITDQSMNEFTDLYRKLYPNEWETEFYYLKKSKYKWQKLGSKRSHLISKLSRSYQIIIELFLNKLKRQINSLKWRPKEQQTSSKYSPLGSHPEKDEYILLTEAYKISTLSPSISPTFEPTFEPTLTPTLSPSMNDTHGNISNAVHPPFFDAVIGEHPYKNGDISAGILMLMGFCAIILISCIVIFLLKVYIFLFIFIMVYNYQLIYIYTVCKNKRIVHRYCNSIITKISRTPKSYHVYITK